MGTLRNTAAVLVLALVASACGGGDDDGERSADGEGAGGTTTSTAVHDPSKPHVDPVETIGRDLAEQQGASQATSAVTPEKRAKYGAPLPGRYRFRLGDDDDGGPLVVIDVIDRDAEFQPPDAVAQVWFRRQHDEGLIRLVEFADAGMVVSEELRYRPDGSSRHCRWEPAYVEVPRRLAPGVTWSADSVCDPQGPTAKKNPDFTARRTASGKVREERTVDVFGRSFTTVAFDWKATDSITGAGLEAGDTKDVLVDWSWTHGLALQTRGVVYTSVAGEGKGAGGTWERILSDPAQPEPTSEAADLHG